MHQIVRLLVIIGLLLTATIRSLRAAELPERVGSALPPITDQYIVVVKAGRDARGVARAAGVTPRHVFDASSTALVPRSTPGSVPRLSAILMFCCSNRIRSWKRRPRKRSI